MSIVEEKAKVARNGLLWQVYFTYVFVLLMPVFINAEPPNAPNIAGDYTYTGTGPKGHYEGTAQVYQKDRAVVVQWDGGKLLGYGVLTGDALALAFASDGVGIGMLCRLPKDELRCEWPGPDGAIWTERHVKGAKRKDAN
jgi:hypothetical protein